MPALQVRDFPEDLYQQLKEYAAANHRSMAQQTIIAVQQMINQYSGEPSYGTSIAGVSARGMSSGRYGKIVHFETEEEREARRARKQAVFDRIDEYYKTHERPQVSAGEIVEMVRKMREERTNRILETVSLHLDDGGAAQ